VVGGIEGDGVGALAGDGVVVVEDAVVGVTAGVVLWVGWVGVREEGVGGLRGVGGVVRKGGVG
jgi:hypothetical protein